MDANGLRFWMLAAGPDWDLGANPRLVYDGARRRLALADARPDPEAATAAWPRPGEAEALASLDQVPRARDAFGVKASWDPASRRVLARGPVPGAIAIFAPPAAADLTDLAPGFDGVLYLAVGGTIVLRDLRARWPDATVAPDDFAAWRLTADPSGGVWALDPTRGAIARLVGLPPPSHPAQVRPPSVFGPVEPHSDPPRIVARIAAPLGERPVALARGPAALALLTWADDGSARLRLLDPAATGDFSPPLTLFGARRPISLAWLGPDRIATLVPGLGEAPAYAVHASGGIAEPLGTYYPLPRHDGGPFAHGLELPPYYPVAGDEGMSGLRPISLSSFARAGEAENALPLDGGDPATVWHRLYLEAILPPQTGIAVWLAATDEPDELVPSDGWHEHRFGSVAGAASRDVPRGAWLPSRCEVPSSDGLLGCPPEPDRAGLFTALIQRPGRRVRALRGRFLRVRVRLHGDGRSTPELASVRAYGSRFSYVDRYLPELYRETAFGPEADAGGAATPADFLERFVDLFEGVLTPLEDRIARSDLLTDARTTPEESLEWLGSWVGVAFAPGFPPNRRRIYLRAAPELARRRGTLRGLALALDIATDGAVGRGEVVLIENFRLRRTFATILGADLADEDDPLLLGLVASGNSFVGDTLFLGADPETHRAFLALFAPGAIETPAEAADVAAFLDDQAHRLTVLVHDDSTPQDLGLIRRVVEQEAPAHVLARVVPAPESFRVGLAALVGVDSYVVPAPPRRVATVDRSTIGAGDVIEQPASLDPRLGGVGPGAFGRPVARAVTPVLARAGRPATLDASDSYAPSPEGAIAEYRWTLIDFPDKL